MSNFNIAIHLLPLAILETLYMVFVSGLFASLVGFPLGITLYLTGKGKFKEQLTIYRVLGALINIGRSFPFAILMVAIIPLTRWIVGTSLGTTASIVPLAIAAAPFIARVIENSLNEVENQIVEAAIVMGSTPWQIIYKVLLMEALPSILSGVTLTLINLVGYSTMAGLIGGGGLGTIAIQYGYQRFNGYIMFWTVVLLILLVAVIQAAGNYLVFKISKKRGKIKAN